MHLAWVSLALTLAAGGTKTKVAVLDVQAPDTQHETSRLLTQVIVGEFAKRPELGVISAAEVANTLGLARQRQLLGCSEDSCLAEIGGALGVDYLVSGTLGKLGSRYRLDLRLVNARNGRIAGTAGDFIAGNEDALADGALRLTDGLVSQLMATIGGQDVPQATANPNPTPAVTNPPAPTSTPTPAVSVAQPEAPGPSHTGAFVAFGAAGALAAGAAVMTVVTRSTYQNYVDGKSEDHASLKWKGPVADGLWAAAIASAGLGTYLYFSASPSPSGSGGEVGVAGRF